jgi:hypothetical protein
MTRCNPLTTALFALAFGLFMLTGCGGSEGDGSDEAGGNGSDTGLSASSIELDHGSPEKLFDSMMAAVAAGDNAAMFAGFTPTVQSELATGMISMVPAAGMIPGSDKPGMIAVLKEHGIAESDLPALGPAMEAKAKELAEGIQDKPAFVAAMMTKLNAAQMPGGGMPAMFPSAGASAVKLADLQTDGDSASAKVTAAGETSADDERINFIKVDGKWYLDAEPGE